MAKSQYEYVKTFEMADELLPHCWVVCRVDGVAFTKFTAAHHLEKPNDRRAMNVMNTAAKAVMAAYPDICICIGMSDEYSFVLHPMSTLYSRRASKINSAIVSLFTSSFVFHWSTFFPTSPLVATNLPFFDGRVVCYPTDAAVKDYLRWRQVDAHINNLYNTTFWLLVRDYQRSHSDWSEKQARDAAHADMNSTYASSAQKNELLHERFGVNYNDEPEEFRKGSILVWVDTPPTAASTAATAAAPADGGAAAIAAATSSDSAAAAADENSQIDSAASSSSSSAAAVSAAASSRPKRSIALIHCDLIHESFYTTHPGIIPYLSATQVHKARTAADKAAKKAAHKAREKEQKLLAGAPPAPAPAAGPAVPSVTDAAAAAPPQP